MDEQRRRLERAAALGDVDAIARLKAHHNLDEEPEPPMPDFSSGKVRYGAWELIKRDPKLRDLFDRRPVSATSTQGRFVQYIYTFNGGDITRSISQFIIDVLPNSWTSRALLAQRAVRNA